MKKMLVILFCAAAAGAHAQSKAAVKPQQQHAVSKKATQPVADIDPVLRNGQADIMRRAGAWRGYDFRPGSGRGGC